MIELKKVTKLYGKNIGLSDVSVHIGEGEIVGLLGKNGAGKTTAMNIMTGYIACTHGEVYVDGYSTIESPLKARQAIGYMPEKPPIYMDMTVNEYLDFCADINKIKPEQRTAHIDDICQLVKISDVRTRLCKNLSKGYKQRVGLAQALIGNPKIIILDEPTAGLDPKQIIEIRKLIKALGKNHTLIISSHILNEVAQICDRVIILDDGAVVSDDTIGNITLNTSKSKIIEITVENADDETTNTLASIDGVCEIVETKSTQENTKNYRIHYSDSTDPRASISLELCGQNQPIIRMESIGQELEDAFIDLIEGGQK